MKTINFILAIAFLMPCLSHAEALEDPTRPYGFSAPAVQFQQKTVAKHEWVLNTTLVSAWQQVAMINGKRLQVGDKINDAVLVNIGHQTVDLLYQGTLINIKLQNAYKPQLTPDSP